MEPDSRRGVPVGLTVGSSVLASLGIVLLSVSSIQHARERREQSEAIVALEQGLEKTSRELDELSRRLEAGGGGGEGAAVGADAGGVGAGAAAGAGVGQVGAAMTVALVADGSALVDGKVVANDAAVLPLAHDAHAKNAGVRVTIIADKSIPHARVIQLLDLLNEAGVSMIAINTGAQPPVAAPASASAAPRRKDFGF